MNETLEELLADKELWKDFEDGPTVEEIRKNHVFTDFDKDPDFIYEYLKGLFVADVYYAMDKQGINKKELAEKLGKSKQYVGRVLNETANFTLKSLAEIACALDMNVAARLFPRDEHIVFEKIQYTLANQPEALREQAINTAKPESDEAQYTTYDVKPEQSSTALNLANHEVGAFKQVDSGSVASSDKEEEGEPVIAA